MSSPTFLLTLIAATSLLVYVALSVVIWRWRANRVSENAPTAEKLLRGPGETLRQKIDSFDEILLAQLLACVFLPTLLILAGIAAADIVPEGARAWTLPAAVLLGFAVLVVCGARLLRILARRRNHYLGYFGERIVSDQLEPLHARGCRVFHDVPAGPGADGKSPPNIDHVIVAPSGVYAIETKTRRRGRARPGYDDFKIIHDGRQIIYPWGAWSEADDFGFKQSLANARWLEKYLRPMLGDGVPEVRAILTFPGWRVEQRGAAPGSPVSVLNPKSIAEKILSAPDALTPAQVDLVARQLDVRCRDVEF